MSPFLKAGNQIISWILRSALHGLLDKHTLLLELKGRKTGKVFCFPVNYADVGQEILVTTSPGRTWWRNLNVGLPVPIWIWERGDRKPAAATLLPEDDTQAAFQRYIESKPEFARGFGIPVENGTIEAGSIQGAGKGQLMISIQRT
jgi:hypothetical protein